MAAGNSSATVSSVNRITDDAESSLNLEQQQQSRFFVSGRTGRRNAVFDMASQIQHEEADSFAQMTAHLSQLHTDCADGVAAHRAAKNSKV